MAYVDLHSHSTASDGTFAPADVAKLAKESGLSAWALTDHDTVGGIAEAAAASAALGIEFLPGIEISAEYPHPGTLHLLGYGVNPASEVLRELTETLLEGRDNRNPRIVEKLRTLGVAITMDEVQQEARAGAPELAHKPIGRPHIAAILLRKGYVSSIKQAFDKYLAPGGLAYFDKERLSPAQAISMIRAAGGLPVLAHPVQLRTSDDEQLRQVVRQLVDLGLAGIEVIHSDHTPELTVRYQRLAGELDLLETGGSDFHGTNKKDIVLGLANGQRIPRRFFDALIERLA